MTSIFLIILSATGVAFYYYWTKKSKTQIKLLLIFSLPAGIILGVFIFIGFLYEILIKSLAGGNITPYVEVWFPYVGYVLWPALFVSVAMLVAALIIVDKKVQKC